MKHLVISDYGAFWGWRVTVWQSDRMTKPDITRLIVFAQVFQP